RRIGRPRAIAAARDDDRDFAREVNKALEDADLATHSPPRVFVLDLRGQGHLSLAVIAHAHALEDSRVAKIPHRPEQCRRVGYFAVGGSLDVDRTKEIFLAQ